MRRRRSATANECLPPMEKRCEAKNSNVPKSRSASSVDEMISSQTLAAVHGESIDSNASEADSDIHLLRYRLHRHNIS